MIIKATFHASPPAPPRTSSVSPLRTRPSHARTPAAGASSVDRQAGSEPSAPHATPSGECARQKDWSNVWDGCNPLAHAEAL
jgi:hypothetical protein